MGCSNCSGGEDGKPGGCGNNGNCSTGGCNKMNTYDWLSHIDLPDYGAYDMVEVSFKRGARKEIYKKPISVHIATGDTVAVDGLGGGYDVGEVTLMGELVKLQLKKHRIKEGTILPKIIRVANQRDIEKLEEARAMEHEALITARVIARSLGLEMKIGDVEYQGDKRKVTFYYTAESRVDFRELIRSYAREFKVKIEMRQIGSRQESARIGGIGSCGRELCCSTWLTDFKSVSTAAARYQNLAINQSKLSGQCGRLKCCLNYELDTYLEVLKEFPKNVDKIRTKKGTAILIKTDVFKRVMYYAYKNEIGISEIHQLSTKQVSELKELNKKGVQPLDLFDIKTKSVVIEPKEKEIEFVDNIDGVLELRPFEKKKKPNNRNRNRNKNTKNSKTSEQKKNPANNRSKNTNNNKVSEQKNKPANNRNKNTNKKKVTTTKSTPLQNKKKARVVVKKNVKPKEATNATNKIANKEKQTPKRKNNRNRNRKNNNTNAKPNKKNDATSK